MGAWRVSDTAGMKSVFIVAALALIVAVSAEESVDAVVPELEAVLAKSGAAAGSAVGQKATTSTHYETQVVPQKEVVQKPEYTKVTVPVEEVHYKPVTKTVPVQKKVEIKTVVETPQTGCDLVVESCFATPAVEETPAWHAPVIKYQHSYENLCAPEAAAKK